MLINGSQPSHGYESRMECWRPCSMGTRKELCTPDSSTSGKQDPWQLLAYIPHTSTVQNLFSRFRQQPESRSIVPQDKVTGILSQSQPGAPAHSGRICIVCLVMRQQGAPMKKSAYLLTTTLCAGEWTMASERMSTGQKWEK